MPAEPEKGDAMKTSSVIIATILIAITIAPGGAQAASSAPTGADDLRFAGKFAFRTDANLEKESCARLTRETASRLASHPYRCETTPLSSGKTALLCSRSANGRGSYMVFDTKAACESERKDQANAE